MDGFSVLHLAVSDASARDNLRITTWHTLISFTFRYPSAFYPFIGTVIAREEKKQDEKDQIFIFNHVH